MEERECQVERNFPKPEGLLYHYTDQKGLLGILGDKNIWATHTKYLNDASEGQIVTQILIDRFTNAYESLNAEVLTQGLSMGAWFASPKAFIASFSEKGDLLSQWRAYSGGTGGYSIGFTPDYLHDVGGSFLCERQDRFYSEMDHLARCIYYDENIKKSADAEIEGLVSAFIQQANSSQGQAVEIGTEGIGATAALAASHFIGLGKLSAVTKHAGFREEAEWRLAFLLTPNSTPSDLKFRPGSSMPVPYLEIPLTWGDRPIEVKEIIIGPCPHPNEASESITMLLKKEHISGVSVICSNIPYRDW